MTTKKLEYDSSLGGSVVLGTHLPTFRYAASALDEIRQLMDAVQQPTSTKLVFQTLPKHMRRRAMSHYPKRLPRKYRLAHCSQMEKAGKPHSTKRPSRKHRRRPANLLKDYLRRQRRHVWLETHIWHARRFHMIDRWGYRLPFASCDKTYRACYRASAEHCLLQDISFYGCVELHGRIEELKSGFERLSSARCGLGIAAKTFLSGRREGSIDLFRDRQYPEGALGRVTFLWRPQEEMTSLDTERTLWLWVHPSAYQSVFEELVKVFELVSQRTTKVAIDTNEDSSETKGDIGLDKDNNSTENGSKKVKKTPVRIQRRLQFLTKTVSREHIPHYANSTRTLHLRELKNTLNRFRLTGPLSQSVLTQAFKVKNLSNLDKIRNSWVTTALSEEKGFLKYHEMQSKYWDTCFCVTSPASLLSNMVLGLNIEDPRLHRPQKRTKAVPPTDAAESFSELLDFLIDVPQTLSHSVIWDRALRDKISSEILSTQAYCDLRAKHAIVPGAPCPFEDSLQPVPVLLIQRPGSQDPHYKRLGYGCGWDVVAPAGYGMPIWLSLIMWGARPGGLREFDSVARESGTEQHLPDSVGGRQTAAERYEELRCKYFRLPPNKRCNYRKLSIVSPFRVPFVQLVRDWATPNDASAASGLKFYVLRDRALLQDVAASVQRSNLGTFPKQLPPECLIQLNLRMKSRGCPDDFSIICLPTCADLKRNLKQIKHSNHEPVYTEPLLADPNEKERKVLRVQHKKLLKRLRARRVREKRRKQETSTSRVYIRPAGTADIVSAQFKKMCHLWLPEDTATLYSVRKQCTREVFGYVTTAHFSYTEATVCAIGYVTVEGLKLLLKVCRQARLKQPMCLLRGTTSRHYRFASFKINGQI